jgi:hypothetical protein
MSVQDSKRFLSFSADEQDVVKAGVELYKHYLYLNKKDLRYSEFATGKSYEEKHKLFTANLLKEAFKRAGVANAGFSDTIMMQNPNVQWANFALISEILSVITPATVLDSFGQFAEIRNGNWGDNFKFTIPNPNLFVVSKIANGIRKGEPQRLYSTETSLTPVAHDVTIQEDFYRVLTGKVDFGDWIMRISQSVDTALSLEIYNAFYGTYGGLVSTFKEATFDATKYVQLGQRVSAANRGAKVGVFGTRVALSKVVPNANFANFGVGAGEEFIRNGFLSNFMGFDTFVLDQRIVANDPTYAFAAADDAIYFVAVGSDKPVKVGFEGTPIIYQGQLGTNADNTIDYSYQQFWDSAIVSSTKYGIMKVS